MLRLWRIGGGKEGRLWDIDTFTLGLDFGGAFNNDKLVCLMRCSKVMLVGVGVQYLVRYVERLLI